MTDPGAPRLGANVYTFVVGDKLERPSQITDESILLERVAAGTIESTLPSGGLGDSVMTGNSGTETSASIAGGNETQAVAESVAQQVLQIAVGFGDTPHDVTVSIQESLCRLDDTFSRNSPQTVHTGQYYRLKGHDPATPTLSACQTGGELAAEREKDRIFG